MIKKIFLTIGSLIIFASNAFAFDMPEGTIGISPLGGTPQMQQYSLAVGKKIIANFNMPDTGSNLAALVIFKVDKTGKLTECEIVQSSGNTDYDNRVLTAVKNASPYPAPNFDEATDVGVLLNMDLNIIKLINLKQKQRHSKSRQNQPVKNLLTRMKLKRALNNQGSFHK